MSNLTLEISGQHGCQRLLRHQCDTAHRPSLAVAMGRDGRYRCHSRKVSSTQDELAEELLKLYPARAYLRMANGPELIATTEKTWSSGGGTDTASIAPGSLFERLRRFLRSQPVAGNLGVTKDER